MKKVLVVLSGVYVVCAGLLLCVWAIAGTFAMRQYQAQMPQGMSPLYVLIPTMLMGGWVCASGVGVLLKKNWARISLIVFSSCAVFMGAGMVLVLLFIPPQEAAHPAIQYAGVLPQANVPQESALIGKVVGMAFAWILFIFIPVFFLFFFTRRSVKDLLARPGQGAAASPPPFGVLLLVVLAWLGVVSTGMNVFFPMAAKVPLVDGIMVSGAAARLWFGVWMCTDLYIALMLGKLKKGAWWVCVGRYLFLAGLSIVNIVTVSEATGNEMMQAFGAYSAPAYQPHIPLMVYKLSMGFSLIVPALALWYLFSRKGLFFNKDKAVTS